MLQKVATLFVLAVSCVTCATPRAPAGVSSEPTAPSTSAAKQPPAARDAGPAPEAAATPHASQLKAAAGQGAAIPDTPAGHVLAAWLAAFNSGDRAQMKAYVTRYKGKMPAAAMAVFRARTGGFDLLDIISSKPLSIEFHVKEKASPTQAVGTLRVTNDKPPRIDDFALRAMLPGMKVADMHVTVDAATRKLVIDGIAENLDKFYVFPKVARTMVAALRANQKKGVYGTVTDGYAFASLLTRQLQAISHDKHLRVDCSPQALPKRDLDKDPGFQARMKAQLERTNCGFKKVELLPGNIGYLKFNMFADPKLCGPTASAAMSFLAHADAVIFDLRDNGGGEPKMIAFIASYLFKARTHINDLYDRAKNKTTRFWTRVKVPGKSARLAKVPVFVLTSQGTFSGAEEFSYDLQQLKRATIIGETTGGGAHPVAPHRLTDHFMIGVPFARAINPITKTNWEGTGVVPDVKVSADKALDVAVKMAMEQIQKAHKAHKARKVQKVQKVAK